VIAGTLSIGGVTQFVLYLGVWDADPAIGDDYQPLLAHGLSRPAHTGGPGYRIQC
jgi:hypothetical protein